MRCRPATLSGALWLKAALRYDAAREGPAEQPQHVGQLGPGGAQTDADVLPADVGVEGEEGVVCCGTAGPLGTTGADGHTRGTGQDCR